jgi:DedD protein
MNDHNLDDLIIDNIEPKNGKAKSILTIIALLIVVLIVGIILTKIILKDPNANQIALEKENTEMISPELTLQNVTKEEIAKPEVEKETLSNIIEKEEPKAPVPTPKVEEIKKETVVEKTESIKESISEPIKETVKITNEFVQEPIPNNAKPTNVKIDPIIETKKEEIKQSKPLPEKIIEKAKEKPSGRPVNIPATKTVTESAYFIQVGSFRKTPSSRFLSIIENSGFNYNITPPSANGIKKLLIGPYENRKTVDTALVRVRDRINKQAFVITK